MASMRQPLQTHRLTCLLPYRPHPICANTIRPRHTPQPITHQQTRHEATSRRHRKKLANPPADFQGGPEIITGSSGRSRTAKRQLPPGSHIIFNPPPSVPNVYHTPPKFLPPEDPRHKLFARQQERLAAASPIEGGVGPGGATSLYKWPEDRELPPLIKGQEKRYHITREQMLKMRELRQTDEATWTRGRLAKEFDCSRIFVATVVQASPEQRAPYWRKREEQFNRWGKRRQQARIDRQKRKEMWKYEV